MKRLFYLLMVLLLVVPALAHQPRLVGGLDRVDVVDPEISKAYYGELEGGPHFFTINSSVPFNLYVNVLIPGKDAPYRVSAEITKDGELFYLLDGGSHEWTPFYEEFGRDHYLKGPEFGKDFKSTTQVDPGIYVIKVYNENNQGTYSLAIGDIESFDFLEILNATILLPILKVFYFDNYILLFGMIGVFAGITFLIYWYYRKR